MENIEEETARWGRVAVAEVIAVLETLFERAPLEQKTAQVKASIEELYQLVGTTNAHQLAEKAKELFAQVTPQDSSKIHAYAPHLLRTAVETLTNAEELDGYLESYTNGLILDLSAHRITAHEVALAKSDIISQEEFSKEFMSVYHAVSQEQRDLITNSVGFGPEKLELAVTTGEITMSELRWIHNILEVRARISITDATTGEVTEI